MIIATNNVHFRNNVSHRGLPTGKVASDVAELANFVSPSRLDRVGAKLDEIRQEINSAAAEQYRMMETANPWTKALESKQWKVLDSRIAYLKGLRAALFSICEHRLNSLK